MFNNPSIYVVGDIHGKFEKLEQFLIDNSPKIILACGDFGFWPECITSYKKLEKYDTQIYFCEGNHEDFESLKKLSETKNFNIAKNIRWMPRGSVLRLGNYNILFMGGAASIDKPNRTPGFDWFPEEIITELDMKNLPEATIDIVISHTSPQEFKMKGNMDWGYNLNDPSQYYLSQILQRYHPKYWYFGHWHYFNSGTYVGIENWACDWTCLNECPHTNFYRPLSLINS